MAPKHPSHPPISPLLKALRLWDRRSRRGVLPPAAHIAEWQSAVDSMVHEGSTEAPELRLRLAAIGAMVFGQAGSATELSGYGQHDRLAGQFWQAVFDAPQRGSLGNLAQRVAEQLARLPDSQRIGESRQLRRVVSLAPPTPLPTTLSDEPASWGVNSRDFVLSRQSISSGFLDRLGLHARYGSILGAYSALDMPFVLDTDLEIDWVEGEPDPFEVPEVIGPTRQMAERLAANGARIQVRRGREVPVNAYVPAEARAAEEMQVAGAYGPVSLGSFSVLDQAVPVEEHPGLLHVILAPGAVEAAKTLPIAEVASASGYQPLRDGDSESRHGSGQQIAYRHDGADLSTAAKPPGSNYSDVDLVHSRTEIESSREAQTEGADEASSAAGPFADSGLDRDDSLPPEQPSRQTISTPERSLRTPLDVPTASTGASAKGSDERSVSGVSAINTPSFQQSLSAGHLRRPLLQVAIDWVSGEDPWRNPELLARTAASMQTLARDAGRVEIVRGREVPFERYVPDQGRAAADLVLMASARPVPLLGVELFNGAIVEAQRPGYLQVLLAPGIARTSDAFAARRDSKERSFPELVLAREVDVFADGAESPDEDLRPPSRNPPDPRRDTGSTSPTRGVSPVAELDMEAATQPTYGLLGARTTSEPSLGRAQIIQSVGSADPLTSLATAPVMRVIDRQNEILRAERLRESAALESPLRQRSPGGFLQPTAQPPEAEIAPLDLPLVVEADGSTGVPVESDTASAFGPDVSIRRGRPSDVAPDAPLPRTVSPVESSVLDAEVSSPDATKPDSEISHDSVTESTTTRSPEPTRSSPTSSDDGLPSEARESTIPSSLIPLRMHESGSPLSQETPLSSVTPAEEPSFEETASSVQRHDKTISPDITSKPISAAADSHFPRSAASETIRITVDWISGEDPWSDPKRVEQAREALRMLEEQGVRVELVRGREVPASQYDAGDSQRAADFQMLTASGPVLLGELNLLESAMLVAQRPGSLEVLLAPQGAAPALTGGQYQTPPDLPLALSEEPADEGIAETEVRRQELSPGQPSITSDRVPVADQAKPWDVDHVPSDPSDQAVLPRAASSDLSAESISSASAAPGRAAEPAPLVDWAAAHVARRAQVVEITLDWVTGADPWTEPEHLEAARESTRTLEDHGVRVVFRRGRELPAASYDLGRGLQSSDFAVIGPHGPVVLDALSLLSGSNLLTQRPGAMEVVLAPKGARPVEARQPSLPEFVYPSGSDGVDEPTVEAATLPSSVPPSTLTRHSTIHPSSAPEQRSVPETVQVVVDWVAGQDPWAGGLVQRTAELVQRLERQGIRLEFVAGRSVPSAEYVEAPAQPADSFVLMTGRGPIPLSEAGWLEQAVLRRQRPGLMHVLLAPAAQPELADGAPGPELTLIDRSDDDGHTRADPSTTFSPFLSPSTRLGTRSLEPPAATLSLAAQTQVEPEPRPESAPMGMAPRTREAAATPRGERAELSDLGRAASQFENGDEPAAVRIGASRPLARPGWDTDLVRPLVSPGELAAEVVERSGEGLVEGPAQGLVTPFVTPTNVGADVGRSSGAARHPLWDNTTSMSVLVYDVTPVEESAGDERPSGERFDGWSSAPSIGSALTYVHDRSPADATRDFSVDQIGGYVIPSTLVYVSEGEVMTAEPRQAARAAADRQPVGSGSTVQRAVTESASPAESGSPGQGANMEALAREVYRQIKWRLVVEHERAGTRRPTRGW